LYQGQGTLFWRNRKWENDIVQYGVIANLMWYEMENHATNIELGEFVVMPNHINGILILNDTVVVVETLHATSLQQRTTPTTPTLPNEKK